MRTEVHFAFIKLGANTSVDTISHINMVSFGFLFNGIAIFGGY